MSKRGGHLWSDDEVQRLTEHMRTGWTLIDFARSCGRTEEGVRGKAKGEGLLKNRRMTKPRRKKLASEFLS